MLVLLQSKKNDVQYGTGSLVKNKYMKTQRVPKYEEVRNKKIYELSKIRGNSYNQIARSYDITPQRVGQIVNNYKKRLENQP